VALAMPYRVAEPRPVLTELDERVLAHLLDGGADADTLFAYLRTRRWPAEDARCEAERRDEAYQTELRVAGPRRSPFPRVLTGVGGVLLALNGVAAWSFASRDRPVDLGLEDEQKVLQAPQQPSAPRPKVDGCSTGVGSIQSCTEACDARVASGCAELGQRLLVGKGAPADPGAGLSALTRACDLGDGLGCLIAGRWYLELAPELERDRALAERLLEKGCAASDADACHTLAKLHPMRADEYRERACDIDEDPTCSLE
jgi:hypothetical protein